MASPNVNDSRRSTPSLLLQPPSSGFSWDPMGGSSFLLPAAPQDDLLTGSEVLDGGEADSFIGQSTQPPPPPMSGLSGHSAHSAFKPVQASQQSSPSPLSQLQQPLRPMQSKSPPTIGRSNFNSPSPHLDNSQMFEAVPSAPPTGTSMYGNIGPPPPTGPSQNFRRQAPLSYAPIPGMQQNSGMQQNPGMQQSSNSVEYSEPQSLPDFQSYSTYSPPIYSNYTSGNPEPAQQNTTGIGGANQEQTFLGTGDRQNSQGSLPGAYSNYKPVQSHWFYRKEVEKKELWLPFSVIDSLNLEEAYKRGDIGAVIATDGGRYDVYLDERVRRSVYWEETPCFVKRSSWFYRAEGQNRYVPYDEVVAEKIEECYREGVTKGIWPQKLELGAVSEAIVMHNSQEVAHYLPSKLPDEWGYVPGQMTLRVVKRGVNEILTVDEGESQHIDHLVFLVQGVGAVCDLKFRSVIECVDDFRSMTLNLTRSHFGAAFNSKKIGRVEVLPIAWHGSLHGDATGIDKRMQKITLPSIPKLRHFTNDTVMDIFFYTSPVYCQTIVDTVGSEINRSYQIFMSRNPHFRGQVSVAGHSLGSLILFDILAHQLESEEMVETPDHHQPEEKEPSISLTDDFPSPIDVKEEIDTLEETFEKLGLQEFVSKFQEEQIDLETLKICSENDIKEMGLPMGPRKKLLAHLKSEEEKLNAKLEVPASPMDINKGANIPLSHSKMSMMNRQDSIASINYMIGVAGTGQPSVVYPKLSFEPSCFFAFGSPIAMFLTVRGLQTIGEDYRLPTCPAFFNIFHPYDPVAFRIETLIDPQLDIKPVLVPHHKGRKRLHLELRDSLTRVGTDLKQKLMDSLRHTWNSISDFARAHRSSAEQVEAELNRVVQEQLEERRKEMEENESTVTTDNMDDILIGQLNGGRRIDYVLQEKPIESFNQYLFALASHTCYWESEDTALMVIKETYALNGVYPEQQQPNNNRVTLYNPAAPISAPVLPSSDFINSNPSPYNINFPMQPPPHPVQQQQNYNPGYDFTAPPDPNKPVAPPPLTGFVRASPIVKR